MKKIALVLAAALAVAAYGQNTGQTVTNNSVEQVDGNTVTTSDTTTVVNDQ